jgi:hypothetical protein
MTIVANTPLSGGRCCQQVEVVRCNILFTVLPLMRGVVGYCAMVQIHVLFRIW